MSDEAEAAPPKKKGGKKKLIMIVVGGVVLIGGGIGAGLYAAGGMSGHAAVKEDPNKPKLVLKDGHEEEDSHAATKGKDGADASPDPAKYKATYYPIEQQFTSNLRDSDGFVQIGLGVSTFYDSKVLDNLKDNEMPVRSAVLLALADQEAFVLSTPEGKEQLQKLLKDAINGALKSRTGYGGVDSVYFTSFIIQ